MSQGLQRAALGLLHKKRCGLKVQVIFGASDGYLSMLNYHFNEPSGSIRVLTKDFVHYRKLFRTNRSNSDSEEVRWVRLGFHVL